MTKSYAQIVKQIKALEAEAEKARRTEIDGVITRIRGHGNTWVGRGKRPQWLRDALAAGKQLSDFEIK